MGFEENIKNWVVLDTQIKQLNDKSKELKDQKNLLLQKRHQKAPGYMLLTF